MQTDNSKVMVMMGGSDNLPADNTVIVLGLTPEWFETLLNPDGSSTVDLSKVGLPVHLILVRGESHEHIIANIMANGGEVDTDMSRYDKDLGIDAMKPEAAAPAPDAEVDGMPSDKTLWLAPQMTAIHDHTLQVNVVPADMAMAAKTPPPLGSIAVGHSFAPNGMGLMHLGILDGNGNAHVATFQQSLYGQLADLMNHNVEALEGDDDPAAPERMN